MEKQGVPSRMVFRYHVCAVLFGTDETILNLPLSNGFSFVKRSLGPRTDYLNKAFGRDITGMLRDYQTAAIDEDDNVVCIEKETTIDLKLTQSGGYFDRELDKDLCLMDRYIRAIRFVKECSLRFKYVSFFMCSETGTNNADNRESLIGSMTYSDVVPAPEVKSKDVVKFHCEQNEIEELARAISIVQFPIDNETLNAAYLLYDLSYHTENYISITLLCTALEVLFINSETNKKERLARRCAVFLNQSKDQRLEYYQRIKAAYKQRSEFVHDGKFLGIANDDIVFLRNCVRDSLRHMMMLPNYDKKRLINNLKQEISALDYWRETE